MIKNTVHYCGKIN